MKDDDDSNQETLLSYSELDTAQPQHHPDHALLLLIVASLVASVIYQAALSTPGGSCEENNKAYHLLRCKVFFFCNAISFGSSVAVLMLLLVNIDFAGEIQSNAPLSSFVILDLIGLTGAFTAINWRKISAFVYAFIVVLLPIFYLLYVVRLYSNLLAPSCPRKGAAIWRVASAAAHHMTGNRSLLLTDGYLPVDGKGVVVHQHAKGGEVALRVRGSGSVRTESIALDDVWYVPGLDSNLVSTGQLARQGCDVTLGPGGCRITRAGALVGSARFTEACHFQLDFLKLADP